MNSVSARGGRTVWKIVVIVHVVLNLGGDFNRWVVCVELDIELGLREGWSLDLRFGGGFFAFLTLRGFLGGLCELSVNFFFKFL